MKKITLNIPDKKLDFFMELVKQLGFEISQEKDISEDHKTIVRDRVKKSHQNPQRLLNWEKVKDNFKLD